MACVCIIVTKLQTIMCDIAGPPGSNPLANAVVCSHLILEYTVRLAIINAVELGRNGSLVFFFFFKLLLRTFVLLPKEVSGHGKGRVKSIPKADKGIGRRASQIVFKMSEKFVQSGFGK